MFNRDYIASPVSAGDPLRLVLYVGSLIGVALATFFLTLWLMDSNRAPEQIDVSSDAERLAGQQVTNDSELRRIAEDVGLKLSAHMAGNIDGIVRVNEREVTIAGWVADREGDAIPKKVIVFVSGAMAATVQTNGERPDVTRAFGLGFGAEKNVTFQGQFSCPTGASPIVVAVAPRRQYYPLASPPCP